MHRTGRVSRAALWWFPLFAMAGVGAFVLAPPSRASVPARATGGAPINAQQIYEEHCSSCHGVNGSGSDRGPSLQGVGAAAVDFELTTGEMPRPGADRRTSPYRPAFSPAVITALDDYVTSLAAHGGPSIPTIDAATGDVARGGMLFRENCAACHGFAGTGGELTGRTTPSITEATPTQVAEAIRVGPAQMPRFSTDDISDNDLNAVAAYVAYIHHPDDKGGNGLSHLGPVAEGFITWLLAMVVLLGFIRWIGKRG